MATDERHAGGETERTYAVQLVAGEAEPRDLTSGLTEFLAAVDFAFEWLQREDPQRDGTDRLSIIETRDGGRHEVWSYPPSEEPSAGQELVEVYGFNPVAWQPPSPPVQAPRAVPPPPPPARWIPRQASRPSRNRSPRRRRGTLRSGLPRWRGGGPRGMQGLALLPHRCGRRALALRRPRRSDLPHGARRGVCRPLDVARPSSCARARPGRLAVASPSRGYERPS